MMEESRLGREQSETGYSLKRILQAGVRLFYYLTDTERSVNLPRIGRHLSYAARSCSHWRSKASGLREPRDE